MARIFPERFTLSPSVAAECVPPMDVIEATDALQVVMDVPGVAPDDIRIVVTDGDLSILGRKPVVSCQDQGAAFHFAERAFGRFVRTLRLTGAFDAGRASATLESGELRIVLPRIDERRGKPIVVAITVQGPG